METERIVCRSLFPDPSHPLIGFQESLLSRTGSDCKVLLLKHGKFLAKLFVATGTGTDPATIQCMDKTAGTAGL